MPGTMPGTMRGLARVVVVGATGAGKSILAQRVATRLGAEYVELDALFWDAGWTQAGPDLFRARVERATAGSRWVVAGNYGRVRDLLWPRADTIVSLDYAFPLVLRRLTARTVRRAVTGEVPWNGNREHFWEHCRLWSEKSVLFAQPAHTHLRIARVRRPREAEAWLAALAPE